MKNPIYNITTMKKTYHLGISWYPSRIKICTVEKNGRKSKVIGLDSLELDVSRSSALADTLSTFVSSRFSVSDTLTATISLPESSVFLKEMDIPTISKKQIDTAVYWEIPTITPVASADALYKWQILSQKAGQTQIAVMVMKNEVSQSLFNAVKKAGIEPLAIIPFSVALAQVAANAINKPTLLMTVDEAEVNCVMLKQGIPVFSTSTNTLINRIGTGTRTLNQQSSDTLAGHAQHAISFGQTKGFGDIHQIIITGEATKYYGLANTVYHHTKIPTFIVKTKPIPIKKHPDINKATLNRDAITVGTALITHPSETALNFLPQQEANKRSVNQVKHIATSWLLRTSLANIVIIGVLALTLMGIYLQEKSIKQQLATINHFIEVHPAQAYVPQVKQANQTISSINQLLESQVDESQHLTLLIDLMPTSLTLQKIKLENTEFHHWRLEGKGDRSAILAYYQTLMDKGLPTDLFMPYTALAAETDTPFILEVIWP